MKKDWTKIKKIRGGHGYWRRIQDGAIGVADESGSYPENCEPCDQPPLLLDRSRPVTVGREGNMIPVTNRTGDKSHTPASGFEALWVATQFHMEVEAREDPAEVPWRFAVLEAAKIDEAMLKKNMGTLRAMWLQDALKDQVP